jgi:Fungal Zn(2)-Cys(6) binuclear cluster domain
MSRPTSLTRRRVPPPPRRKACEECNKAKRRCDLSIPACLRCERQKLLCCYARLPAQHVSTYASQASQNTTTNSRVTINEPSLGPITSPSLYNLDSHGFPDLRSTFSIDMCALDDLPTLEELQNSDTPAANGNFGLILPSASIYSPNYDSSSAEIMARVGPRLNYAVDVLKATPTKVVFENQTPWSHHLLYKDEMPRSIQSKP